MNDISYSSRMGKAAEILCKLAALAQIFEYFSQSTQVVITEPKNKRFDNLFHSFTHVELCMNNIQH